MEKRILSLLLLLVVLHAGGAFGKGEIPPSDPPRFNFHGMWWASPGGSESGWAIGISHQGESLHATWFTYDGDGEPMWLVVPRAARTGYDWYEDRYSGPLFRTTGPAFDAEPWDDSKVRMIHVGTANFSFGGSSTGFFHYSVNGVVRGKRIEKQRFASRPPVCEVGGASGTTPNYTDLWAAEAGWGVYIAHQGEVVFATWSTYAADGENEWLVMPNAVRTGGMTYSGTLYRTRGPAFSASPWNPALVTATPVGSATLTFGTGVVTYSESNNPNESGDQALFEFTVGSASRSRTLFRRIFDAPASVCRSD